MGGWVNDLLSAMGEKCSIYVYRYTWVGGWVGG